jgi:hypothetical protein
LDHHLHHHHHNIITMLFVPIHENPKIRDDNAQKQGLYNSINAQLVLSGKMVCMALDECIQFSKEHRKRQQLHQLQQQQRSSKKIKLASDTIKPVKQKRTTTNNKEKNNNRKRQEHHHQPLPPCLRSKSLMAAPLDIAVVALVTSYLDEYLVKRLGANRQVSLSSKQVEDYNGQQLATRLRELNSTRHPLVHVHGLNAQSVHGLADFKQVGTTRRRYVTLFANVRNELKQKQQQSPAAAIARSTSVKKKQAKKKKKNTNNNRSSHRATQLPSDLAVGATWTNLSAERFGAKRRH